MVDVSVVILTRGDRPGPLAGAITSARRQVGASIEIVLVVNHSEADVDDSIADIVVRPGTNLGIPGGRNLGADMSSGTYLCFLDDDGVLHDDVFVAAVDAFNNDPRLAVIGLHVVDPDGQTARRHVPGLRKKPNRSRPATSFPGGASIIRRSAFDSVGRLCAPFHYGLEETDLAWRLLDGGWSIEYRADLRMTHPRTSPTRHEQFVFSTARNRVWLAYRALPLPLAALYLATWAAITLTRNLTRPTAVLAHLQGSLSGARAQVGPRRPIRWRTVSLMSRLGRPPIV